MYYMFTLKCIIYLTLPYYMPYYIVRDCHSDTKKKVISSVKYISKKALFILLFYVFFDDDSESEVRFWQSPKLLK